MEVNDGMHEQSTDQQSTKEKEADENARMRKAIKEAHIFRKSSRKETFFSRGHAD